jgi:PKD domain
MKKIHLILSLTVLGFLLSCTKENDDLSFLETIPAPKNISALVTTSQNNTGTVTFLPKGEGVTHYEIYFGDGTAAPAVVKAGETVSHVYAEGTYQAKIIGITLNGQKTEVTQEVVVSLSPPTNLVATITTGTNLSVKVKATADSETFFKVYFGDGGANEVPVEFMEGQEVSHTYASAGTYQVKVVALNGGITTIETTKTVVITNLTAAPVPTKNAANVISLFSDTYTNPTVNFRTDWSADSNPLKSLYKAITIAGNNAIEYSELSYVGIEPAVQINGTQMTHFHLDVWSPDFTTFKVKLVDYGANGVWEQNGDNVEHEITIDAPAKEQWVGIDIPLSNFTGLTTRAHIAQLILSGAPFGSAKVIVDNIYFYKESTESIKMPLDFESSTLTYSWVGFGGSTSAQVIDNPNKTGVNTSNKVVSIQKTADAPSWAGASLALTAPIDLTKGTKIKVTVWSPKVGAKIRFKTEDTTSPKDGNGTPTVFVEKDVLTTVANDWQVLTFDLSTAAGYNASNSYRNIVLFPDFDVAGTGTTYYFDNIEQSN